MSEKTELTTAERGEPPTHDPMVHAAEVTEESLESHESHVSEASQVSEGRDTDDGVANMESGAVSALAAPRRQVKDRTAQLEREGEVAADFLERLLDIADLDGDIDVDVDGDRASVAIIDSEEGHVPRSLVGQHGRVLEALQELTRMAVQAATGERSRLMLDVAGHRAQRREAVLTVTRHAIDEVRASGEPAPLQPMSAFERKVAHDEVLAAGLASESEGVEPNRHVVVLPA